VALCASADDIQRDLPAEVMPDRHWDFTHLDLDVRVDIVARTLSGTAIHTVHPLGARVGELRLHQVALDIQTVTVDGDVVEGWRIGRDTLDIPMPATGDVHEVAVTYSARPRTGLHFRGGRDTSDPGHEVWSQGEGTDNRYWYPGWDYPNDKFTVSTKLTVDSEFLAFANGPLVSRTDLDDGWTTWAYALDRPIVNYLVAIAAGDYALYADDGEVPLEYVTPSTVDAQGAQLTMGYAKPQLTYFTSLLKTPYPYPNYRQVLVTRFLYGGMENAGMTILADTMLVRSDLDRSQRAEDVVAHELAHQWFGDLLTCYGWRELWLNEGFATFYTGRWIEHTQGPDAYAAKVDGWMRRALYAQTPMAARSWSKVGDRENEAVYVRGASVLHMLRVHLGDEVFDAGIAAYVERNADRLVESSDLRRALEDVSGTHLGWLFDQWVYGVGAPSIETHWTWTDGELVVTLSQTTEGTPFSAPVAIEIGPDLRRTVWLGAGETRLVMSLDEAPKWVSVDPQHGVLATWEHTQDAESWLAQALESPTAGARLVAVSKLANETETDAIRSGLRTIALDADRHASLRRAALRSLRHLGSEVSVAVLLEAAGSENRHVREQAVDSLGEVVPTPEILTRLARIATHDLDATVRASAVAAMAELAPARGAALARSALSKRDEDPRSIEHVTALRTLGSHGTAADFPLLLRHINVRETRNVRSAASRAAMHRFREETDDFRDRERARLAAPLVRALVDVDLRTRQGAISQLGRTHEPSAEAALLRLASETDVLRPNMAALARDAAALIRSGPPAESDDERNSDDEAQDLERMMERLDDLQDRLRRLEEWR
jgi:aminopeptidase N